MRVGTKKCIEMDTAEGEVNRFIIGVETGRNGRECFEEVGGKDGEDGKPGKPFLLPQKNPDFYDYQLYSFNIPELITGEIEVSPYKIQQVATKEKPQNVKFSESGN